MKLWIKQFRRMCQIMCHGYHKILILYQYLMVSKNPHSVRDWPAILRVWGNLLKKRRSACRCKHSHLALRLPSNSTLDGQIPTPVGIVVTTFFHGKFSHISISSLNHQLLEFYWALSSVRARSCGCRSYEPQNAMTIHSKLPVASVRTWYSAPGFDTLSK